MTLGGSLRLCYELKDDFKLASGFQDYVLSQLRLRVAWKTRDRLTFFVQGQDARVFRESKTADRAVNEDAVPNIFADELDLHHG